MDYILYAIGPVAILMMMIFMVSRKDTFIEKYMDKNKLDRDKATRQFYQRLIIVFALLVISIIYIAILGATYEIN